MSNFVMVFNFCLDQGAVKGLSGVHPRWSKPQGVLACSLILLGNIKVESKASLVFTSQAFSAWEESWWNLMKYQDFLEHEWKHSYICLLALMGFWERKIMKSKIIVHFLNLDWFHLTGEVPVLINFLKFFLCTLAHRPVDIWRV